GCEPFVDFLNSLADERRTVFFKDVDGDYIGSPSGLVVPYNDFSEFGTLFYQPNTPVIFLDYSSVEFLLAEAAERGLAGVTDPAAHYSAAIKASFEYYGLGANADAYLALPDVAHATAPGTWKKKRGMRKGVA